MLFVQLMVASRTDNEYIAGYTLLLRANPLNWFVMTFGYPHKSNTICFCQIADALCADKRLLFSLIFIKYNFVSKFLSVSVAYYLILIPLLVLFYFFQALIAKINMLF
jgi:hypothetical protein